MKGSLATILAGLALVGAPPTAADSLAVTSLRLERSGGAWQASVEWRVPWDRKPFNEVHEGVPIDFTVELELLRDRGWWFDASVEKTRVRQEIYYNRLTRQYRVIDWATGQRLFTRKWPQARRQAQRTGSIEVAKSDRVQAEVDYYVGARVVARREQLSLPARIVASLTSLWEGASEWRYRPLAR
ncbi:DUF4390 domain-containing protein [Thiohalorhabdus sp.]|uniref:DUF4390 domain-containing protein n=1 Tax=Thiohalorhabdus sp. TaxID=3094134 RepID=UPI002FC33423